MKAKAGVLSLKFVQLMPHTQNQKRGGHPERSVRRGGRSRKPALSLSKGTCISIARVCNKLRIHDAGIPAALLAGMIWLPLVAAGFESAPSSSGPAPGAVAQAPDSGLFADGTQAINQARWADAVRYFTTVASQHGEHADGALYWKAYAQGKLGQFKPSEESCAELRSGYPKSPWIDDCDAMEVEIRAKTGKTVQIEPGQSDEVKLLALNAMMRQNEPQALKEIQDILNGDSS